MRPSPDSLVGGLPFLAVANTPIEGLACWAVATILGKRDYRRDYAFIFHCYEHGKAIHPSTVTYDQGFIFW